MKFSFIILAFNYLSGRNSQNLKLSLSISRNSVTALLSSPDNFAPRCIKVYAGSGIIVLYLLHTA